MKIQKNTIDALRKEKRHRALRVYDSTLRGFSATIGRSGDVSFHIRYQVGRRRRWYKVGEYGPMTVEAAREEAKRQLARVMTGIDPAGEKERRSTIPTFSEWATECMADVDKRRKSADEIRRYVKVAEKAFGTCPLNEIEPADISRLHKSHASTPTAANRLIATIAPLFSRAVRERVISSSPVIGVERFREAPPRARYLSDIELARLWTVLEREADVQVVAAIRLSLESGMRLSEVLRLRWSVVDLDRLCIRLPDTKAGRPQFVFIAPETAAWLKEHPRVNSYVIGGHRGDKPRYDIKRGWNRVRQEAQLSGLIFHDVRRTHGAVQARVGGLLAANRQLRHSSPAVTALIYAPADEHERRAAVASAVPHLRRIDTKAR